MVEPSSQKVKKRLYIVSALALWQFLLLVYLLAYFTSFSDESKINLEYGTSPQVTDNLSFSRSEILNTASILSGNQFTGRYEANPLSFNVNYSGSNMVWFMLERSDNLSASLFNWPQDYLHVKGEVWHKLKENLKDGVVNFIYDTGSDVSIRDAWSGFVVETLNRSPFMPWQKRLDFVIISTLGYDSGFDFINNLNSDTIFICPNIAPQKFTEITSLEIAKSVQAVTVPPGIHPLFEGVWALVVPIDQDKFELDLLVRRRDGTLALFCGAGCGDLAGRFSLIKGLLHEVPSLIVGNFNEGYVMWNDSEIQHMKQLAAKYPQLKIAACGGVSFAEYEFLQSIFGDNIYCSSLGERLSL